MDRGSPARRPLLAIAMFVAFVVVLVVPITRPFFGLTAATRQ